MRYNLLPMASSQRRSVGVYSIQIVYEYSSRPQRHPIFVLRLMFSVDTGTTGQHAHDENQAMVHLITIVQLSSPRRDQSGAVD